MTNNARKAAVKRVLSLMSSNTPRKEALFAVCRECRVDRRTIYRWAKRFRMSLS